MAVLGEGEVEVALVGWIGCGFTLDTDVGCGMLQVDGDGVPVAQLDRALASGAKGCRFESCLGRIRISDVPSIYDTPPLGQVPLYGEHGLAQPV